jgi:putative transposase
MVHMLRNSVEFVSGMSHEYQRYFRLRKSLQHIGTRSAKRKLHKISGKERRFKKDTNHCLSRYIISKAKGTARAIGIENLKYIRSRSRVTVRSQRETFKVGVWRAQAISHI